MTALILALAGILTAGIPPVVDSGVTDSSGSDTVTMDLYVPPGDGPFPAVML